MDSEFLCKFLEAEPPYKEISITQQQFSIFMELESLCIENFCGNCGKERTFQGEIRQKCATITKELCENSPQPHFASQKQEYIGGNHFINFEFTCTHCGTVHYFALMINHEKILKYGQYPSFSKIETQQFSKYKNIISKYYTELTSATNAYSQNMGIASFVYLRRILEHLVEEKYKQYNNIDKSNVRFIDKLEYVEKYEALIPEEFQTEKGMIYSVLSKGVHEYDENECIQCFPLMQFVITEILDKELSKKDREQKIKQVKKLLHEKIQ